MTVLSAILECFDPVNEPEADTPTHSADYLDGFAAGQEAAQSKIQAAVSAHDAETLQSLSDLAFGYHEAREHILGALSPVMVALVEKVLPRLARDGLADRVADYLAEVLRDAADAPICLTVSPGARPALERALEKATALPLLLVEDPTLTLGQVLVRSTANEAEALIDTDAIAETIRETLSAIISQERTSQHG